MGASSETIPRVNSQKVLVMSMMVVAVILLNLSDCLAGVGGSLNSTGNVIANLDLDMEFLMDSEISRRALAVGGKPVIDLSKTRGVDADCDRSKAYSQTCLASMTGGNPNLKEPYDKFKRHP